VVRLSGKPRRALRGFRGATDPAEKGRARRVHSETGIASQGQRFSADGFGRLRLSYCPTGSPCLEREDHVAQIFAASREAIVHRRWRQARHFPQDQRVTLQFAQSSDVRRRRNGRPHGIKVDAECGSRRTRLDFESATARAETNALARMRAAERYLNRATVSTRIDKLDQALALLSSSRKRSMPSTNTSPKVLPRDVRTRRLSRYAI